MHYMQSTFVMTDFRTCDIDNICKLPKISWFDESPSVSSTILAGLINLTLDLLVIVYCFILVDGLA